MGRREKVFIGSICGAILVTHLFVYVIPKMNKNKYQDIQSQNREGIAREEIQPGDMKIWSDPFDREKSTKSGN